MPTTMRGWPVADRLMATAMPPAESAISFTATCTTLHKVQSSRRALTFGRTGALARPQPFRFRPLGRRAKLFTLLPAARHRDEISTPDRLRAVLARILPSRNVPNLIVEMSYSTGIWTGATLIWNQIRHNTRTKRATGKRIRRGMIFAYGFSFDTSTDWNLLDLHWIGC